MQCSVVVYCGIVVWCGVVYCGAVQCSVVWCSTGEVPAWLRSFCVALFNISDKNATDCTMYNVHGLSTLCCLENAVHTTLYDLNTVHCIQ